VTERSEWEDPATWSDWIADLAERLVQQDLQYVGLKRIERMKLDPDTIDNPELANADPRSNAVLTAAKTISVVVAALEEIPTFETGWGLATLRDVAAALSDVDAGSRPKLLEPRPDQRPPKVGYGRRVLIATLVLCTELLKASGDGEMEACSTVAAAFSDVGHRGRNGGALSPKTIFEWSFKSGDDMKRRVIIDAGLGQWRAGRGWPPQRAEVEDFIRSKTLDPFLLTQI
jgi:hypothetical protein